MKIVWLGGPYLQIGRGGDCLKLPCWRVFYQLAAKNYPSIRRDILEKMEKVCGR